MAKQMKTHPVDRRVVRLWLLREICLFLSGRISSGKFDDDFFGGTKFKLIASDPTCYDVAYWFWNFYDDFKDQAWSELFDANDEENGETVRIIGDILILLTSEFEFAGTKKDGCLTTLFRAFFRLLFFWTCWLRRRSKTRLPYPFLSKICLQNVTGQQHNLNAGDETDRLHPGAACGTDRNHRKP